MTTKRLFNLAALSLGSIVGLILTGSIRLGGRGRARVLGAALFLTAVAMGSLGLVRVAVVALTPPDSWRPRSTSRC